MREKERRTVQQLESLSAFVEYLRKMVRQSICIGPSLPNHEYHV